MDSLNLPQSIREDVRSCIQKRWGAFEQGYRQNVALLGPEGSGKSFLLEALFHALSGQPGYLPVYLHADTLDFETLVDRWTGALLSGLFLSQSIRPPVSLPSLMMAADPIIPKTMERVRALKKMIRREKNAASVRELFALSGLLSEETDKKIVLMIDEFEALRYVPTSDPFSILGREIMVEKNTLYLLSSSQTSAARQILNDQLSLLFGNFEMMELKPLGFAQTLDFLEASLPRMVLTERQKKFLIRMTDGFPFYLSCVAAQLQDRLRAELPVHFEIGDALRREAQDEWLMAALEEVLWKPQGALHAFFQQKLDRCRSLAKDPRPYWRLLVLASQGKRRPAHLAASLGKKTGETKKMLQRLIQEGLMTRKGSFYIMGDGLFCFWLREVYARKSAQILSFSEQSRRQFSSVLEEQLNLDQRKGALTVLERMEELFRSYHNDVAEIEGREYRCPLFTEASLRFHEGRPFALVARRGSVRWFCQVEEERVLEEDVLFFLEEAKRFRKKSQRKILVALAGIDQNAKLLAQEAKVQLWDLRQINTLFDLYGLPKWICFSPPTAYRKGSPSHHDSAAFALSGT